MSATNGHPESNGEGGKGDCAKNTAIFSNVGHTRESCNLIGLAIRRGWNIPESVYEKLPGEVEKWIDRCTDWKDKAALVRILTLMDSANQRDALEAFRAYAASRGLDMDGSTDRTIEWVEPEGLLE